MTVSTTRFQAHTHIHTDADQAALLPSQTAAADRIARRVAEACKAMSSGQAGKPAETDRDRNRQKSAKDMTRKK